MKKLNKILLVGTLMMSFILSGCKSGESNDDKHSTGEKGQKIIFALHNEPDGIDPNVTTNSFASPFLSNCFEGLVSLDENNELVPATAEKWNISEDGLTYTFTLRENLKWSDGSALTSKDFKYSIVRMIIPETTAGYVDMVTNYVKNAQEFYDGQVSVDELGVQTPDDQTLVIELKQPTPFFINILSMHCFSPIQEETIEKNGDKWTHSAETYVSNGPFKISEIKMGESVILVKNEHYWDADSVNLEEINFRYIKDQATALTAFQSGEIDGFRSVPLADLPILKAESDDFISFPTYATTYYLINNRLDVYKDPRVRKALNLAIDRQSIIDNVLQSTGIPASALVGPGYVLNGKDYIEGRSDFGIKPTAQVEEARALLAEAGYPEGKGFPTLKLSYYTDVQVKIVVETLAQMLKENLQIDVEISNQDWAVYYDGVKKGDYEVGAMGWGADYMHPMTFLQIMYSTDNNNNAGYSNPKYDELIDAAKNEMDPEKAVKLMREAEDVMMNDYAIINLYHRTSDMMMKNNITGWYLTPTSNLNFKHAMIESEES